MANKYTSKQKRIGAYKGLALGAGICGISYIKQVIFGTDPVTSILKYPILTLPSTASLGYAFPNLSNACYNGARKCVKLIKNLTFGIASDAVEYGPSIVQKTSAKCRSIYRRGRKLTNYLSHKFSGNRSNPTLEDRLNLEPVSQEPVPSLDQDCIEISDSDVYGSPEFPSDPAPFPEPEQYP